MAGEARAGIALGSAGGKDESVGGVDLHQIVVDYLDDESVSDYFFASSSSPAVCVKNDLVKATDRVVQDSDIEAFLNMVLAKGIQAAIDRKDFSIMINGRRLRANLASRWQGLDLSLRLLPKRIKTLDELHLPSSLYKLMGLKQGLILVCGATGSGKSTTMASLIEHVNENYPKKIVTIEDPIEYLIHEKKAFVCQREITNDEGFLAHLRGAMRQHPNIIMVGEMRDRDTTDTALQAAKTGHLVLSTLHTDSTVQTIKRISDMFSDDSKGNIKSSLSSVLRAVIVQRLIRGNDGNIHIAYEVCVVTRAIANCIREKEDKLQQIPNMMMSSAAEGCVLLNKTLVDLISQHAIRLDEAKNYSYDPDSLEV
jgi:twitching motility protein PilT